MNAAVEQVVVHMHPAVAGFFAQYEPAALRELERELSTQIIVHQSADGAVADYSVTAVVAQPAAK